MCGGRIWIIIINCYVIGKHTKQKKSPIYTAFFYYFLTIVNKIRVKLIKQTIFYCECKMVSELGQ